MAYCLMCSESIPDDALLEHLRLIHPEFFNELERWPDGGIVVHDDTLEPEEFT